VTSGDTLRASPLSSRITPMSAPRKRPLTAPEFVLLAVSAFSRRAPTVLAGSPQRLFPITANSSVRFRAALAAGPEIHGPESSRTSLSLSFPVRTLEPARLPAVARQRCWCSGGNGLLYVERDLSAVEEHALPPWCRVWYPTAPGSCMGARSSTRCPGEVCFDGPCLRFPPTNLATFAPQFSIRLPVNHFTPEPPTSAHPLTRSCLQFRGRLFHGIALSVFILVPNLPTKKGEPRLPDGIGGSVLEAKFVVGLES